MLKHSKLPALLVALTVVACSGDDGSQLSDPAKDDGAPSDRDASSEDAGSDTSDLGSTDGGVHVQPTDAEIPGDAGSDARSNTSCEPSGPMELGTIPNFGVPTAIAVGADGIVHLAYVRTTGNLFYGTNAEGAWETGEVEGEPYLGEPATLLVDGEGTAHLLFKNRHLTRTAGVWTSQEYAGVANVGRLSHAMAVDDAGYLHIATTSQQGIEYATNVSGTWATTTFPRDAACATVGIDADDEVHLGYCTASGDVGYDFFVVPVATAETTASDVQIVANAVGSGPVRLAFDSTGVPAIAYSRGSYVRYARDGARAMLDDKIGLLGFLVSDADRAHILTGYHTQGLWHSVGGVDGFEASVIEDSFLEGFAAMARADDGRIHIAYIAQLEQAKRVRQLTVCP